MDKTENNLQIFNSEEFGEIRTVTINNEPWFVGKDVAEALGYAEPRSAVSKKVEQEDRGVSKMETPSGVQDMTIINESGVYALVFGSKLESAKRFKRWVTHEILPMIRKTGGYVNDENLFIDTYLPFADEQTKLLFSTTLQTVKAQNKIIAEQKETIKEQATAIEQKEIKIQTLEELNDILTESVLDWDYKALINALIRSYACVLGGDPKDYGKAWGIWKRECLYKYSININARRTHAMNESGKKVKTLDMLYTEEELINGAKTAVAMCTDVGATITALDKYYKKADPAA